MTNNTALDALCSLRRLAEVKAVIKDYETLGELSVPLQAIKRFRQMDSRCPGHPHFRWTSGVETTTGPLGNGLATSVGIAIAGRWMGAHFNQFGFENLIHFNVYAICGDGCMMEGILAEAASLAGHLKLSNLCWIYDNSYITIEGHTAPAFSEDVATRFICHGWNVTRVGDANDEEMLARAFRTFLSTGDRPTLIIVDNHIAYAAPNKQDTSAADGEPLGEQEIKGAKRHYGWPEDAKFFIPEGVYDHFKSGIGKRGKGLRVAWFARVREYKARYPELAPKGHRRMSDNPHANGGLLLGDLRMPDFSRLRRRGAKPGRDPYRIDARYGQVPPRRREAKPGEQELPPVQPRREQLQPLNCA
jgi:transketolase